MRLAVFTMALALPAVSAAADRCPWLNAATAGGVLGGDVTAVNLTPTSCEFVRAQGASDNRLFISVEAIAAPYPPLHCGAEAAPLKAIGNEAAACRYKDAEQVVGRVRNQAFVVRLSTSDHAGQAVLREKARQIAEQIAGSLF